ncbi:MAG TPA: mechanosensitive ion channel domain-containing protein [Coleofasciculaceae cyanobacterium]
MGTSENTLTFLQIIPIGLGSILVVIALPKLVHSLLGVKGILASYDVPKIYQEVVEANRDIWWSVILLIIADVILLITGLSFPKSILIRIIEFPIGLTACLTMTWLGYQIIKRWFKVYVTKLTQSGRKINEDLLIIAKWLFYLIFLFIVITIFSETHAINIFGLIASLGVGGIAIAFAAQKTLEQLLGGIVLFLDPPFTIDDYIGLPDSTFGKVESIGLRTTKIRTSGKGTLVVVPNNYLTGINIENFTGASRTISIIKVNFSELIPETQQAYMHQLILDSIVGTEIDPHHISVSFQDFSNESGQKLTQGQVKYYIPFSGELSQEFRRQIVHIIGENIRQKLLDNEIGFEIVDRVWVDSKISI